jgi:hypothetical protein
MPIFGTQPTITSGFAFFYYVEEVASSGGLNSFPHQNRNKYGYARPLRLQLGLFNVSIISDAAQIAALFRAPARSMSAKQRTMFALPFFGLPPRALAFYATDDLGPEARPRAASRTPPEHRIVHIQSTLMPRYMSGPYLVGLGTRFVAQLRRSLDAAHAANLAWAKRAHQPTHSRASSRGLVARLRKNSSADGTQTAAAATDANVIDNDDDGEFS